MDVEDAPVAIKDMHFRDGSNMEGLGIRFEEERL